MKSMKSKLLKAEKSKRNVTFQVLEEGNVLEKQLKQLINSQNVLFYIYNS